MERDELRKRLNDGWTVAGYSCTMMALSAMTQSTLIQKGDRLENITVAVNNRREVGRSWNVIC